MTPTVIERSQPWYACLLCSAPWCGTRAARPNETLLLAARGGVRQAVAVLAHGARPAALYLIRCSRTLRR